jgi:hypothetical protein
VKKQKIEKKPKRKRKMELTQKENEIGEKI